MIINGFVKEQLQLDAKIAAREKVIEADAWAEYHAEYLDSQHNRKRFHG